jgi:tetratricopeptide (TPR) repeat protein
MKFLIGAGVLGDLLLILLTAYGAPAQELAAAAPTFQKIDGLLNQGDNQQACQLLQDVPEDRRYLPEKLWRLARVHYEMGRLAASDQDAMAFYQNAEKYARAAIAKNPQGGDGYKWLAIALGAQTKDSDTEAQILLSRAVKENIEKAIALAPEDDIAYLVLSRWHYKISALDFFSRAVANIVYGGLPEASLSDAEQLLLQAIKLNDRIVHRYHLAKVYERMDRREEAKAQLQMALLLPVTFPEEAEELAKARGKLQEWR